MANSLLSKAYHSPVKRPVDTPYETDTVKEGTNWSVENKHSIKAERLANKLRAIFNMECPELHNQVQLEPRIPEMLWFVEWKFRQPGGGAAFAKELVEAFPERIGTPTMVKAGRRKLTPEEILAVFDEIPRDPVQHMINCLGSEEIGWQDRKKDEWLRDWDYGRLVSEIEEEALSDLQSFLAAMCVDRGTDFSAPWYFPGLIGAVIEFMGRHERTTLARIAKTAVAGRVFDALEFAYSSRVMVMIEGNSRFGKTEAVKAWCDSRPGQARIVNVPSSNNLHDLISRAADAFGIQHTYSTPHRDLKAKVEFVIKHSGLFLVADEGSFLLPQSYDRSTSPARLNWVRTMIVDQGQPFAIVATPQSFRTDVNRFVRKTGYAMEQFLGRMLTIALPTDLSNEDLIGVARVHFPDLDNDYLGYIAAHARLSESYLKTVELVAKRARHFANRDNRVVRRSDLDRAFREVIPESVRLADKVNLTDGSEDRDIQGATSRNSTVKAHLTGNEQPPKRGARSIPPVPDCNPCSLRGGALDRTLVPTEV